MRKQLFKALFICLMNTASCQLHAQVFTPSPVYLLPSDTVFLHIDAGGKWFPHTIRPGQTLYSIAQFYGISLNELYQYNPNFRNRAYEQGEQVRIPLPNRAIIRYRSPDFTASEFVPVCYVVRPGNTLYHIATRLFQMPIDTIMRRNGLNTYEIYTGQPIHIGWMSIHGIPDSLHHVHRGPLWDKSYELGKKFNAIALDRKMYFARGPAYKVKYKAPYNSDGLHVLFNKAPKGSIIAITNPMSNREVFAKVVGKIPPNYDPSALVVLSPAIVHMLGILDEKSFVHVKYF